MLCQLAPFDNFRHRLIERQNVNAIAHRNELVMCHGAGKFVHQSLVGRVFAAFHGPGERTVDAAPAGRRGFHAQPALVEHP